MNALILPASLSLFRHQKRAILVGLVSECVLACVCAPPSRCGIFLLLRYETPSPSLVQRSALEAIPSVETAHSSVPGTAAMLCIHHTCIFSATPTGVT
jgi:hypothetical protein